MDGSALAEALVIAADEFGVAAGHGIAIERGDCAGVAAGEFFADTLTDFDERIEDKIFKEIPLRTLRVADVLGAHLAGAIENLREVIAKIGFVDHFLDVAKLVGPTAEIGPGDRTFGHGRGACACIHIVRAAAIKETLAAIVVAGLIALALPAALTFTLLIALLLIVGGLLAILTFLALTLLPFALLARLAILLALALLLLALAAFTALASLALLIGILRELAFAIAVAGFAGLFTLLLAGGIPLDGGRVVAFL